MRVGQSERMKGRWFFSPQPAPPAAGTRPAGSDCGTLRKGWPWWCTCGNTRVARPRATTTRHDHHQPPSPPIVRVSDVLFSPPFFSLRPSSGPQGQVRRRRGREARQAPAGPQGRRRGRGGGQGAFWRVWAHARAWWMVGSASGRGLDLIFRPAVTSHPLFFFPTRTSL